MFRNTIKLNCISTGLAETALLLLHCKGHTLLSCAFHWNNKLWIPPQTWHSAEIKTSSNWHIHKYKKYSYGTVAEHWLCARQDRVRQSATLVHPDQPAMNFHCPNSREIIKPAC